MRTSCGRKSGARSATVALAILVVAAACAKRDGAARSPSRAAPEPEQRDHEMIGIEGAVEADEPSGSAGAVEAWRDRAAGEPVPWRQELPKAAKAPPGALRDDFDGEERAAAGRDKREALARKAVAGALRGSGGAATRLFGRPDSAEGRAEEVGESGKDDSRGEADRPALAAPQEAAELDGPDACTTPDETPGPLPRRCHLSSTYHAGTAAWQRRLRAIALLPSDLAATAVGQGDPAGLEPPTATALAVDAWLSRSSLEGPGQVWLRIGLRSTDRWGMRRPPFDLAVVLGQRAATLPDHAACRALEALVTRVEPQDRLTVVWGAAPTHLLDGVAGSEAGHRVRSLCAQGVPAPAAGLAEQHAVARRLLGEHAAAQHRVAGTRLVVVLAAADEADPDALWASVAAGVQEPTLTSVFLLGTATAGDAWWDLAGSGHGALEVAPAGAEQRAAQALWDGWGRVVARLVRVDIRLAAGVVAQRVVGARVLDAAETRAVRRREQAIDHNLARVAGVAADRQDDGEGMTMLIPAFLGSDHHDIDVLLDVPGPGPVADVVVDYKDLVRMANAKAMARAALPRLPPHLARHLAAEPGTGPLSDTLPVLQDLRDAVARGDRDAIPKLAAAAPGHLPAGTVRELGRALADAASSPATREALVALLDAWLARGRGCHVVAEP